jgi:hypothetical protein
MALRATHICIGAAALASLALAACNLNGNNNTNTAPDNSANAAPADNSASNETNAIVNAARLPRVGGGDNQH